MKTAVVRRPDAALDPFAPWLVLLGGVSAAMHVAKLPPALPALQAALGIGWIESGFLLSLVQLASMTLGVLVGVSADGLGLRRSMVGGLLLLSGVGALGGWAHEVTTLLVMRALEGVGFLLVVVSAPALLRRCVQPTERTRMLGIWGAFMPLGTAMALLLGPAVIALVNWPGWWWATALLSAVAAGAIVWRVPGEPAAIGRSPSDSHSDWASRLGQTLRVSGPWLGALTFAVYSAQWLAVIGFLPSLYALAGWGGTTVAVLTALVAAANIVGNVAAGRLLHRQVSFAALLAAGFGAMAFGAFLAFGTGNATLRYAGALLFSAMGGLIPGTLFVLAPRLAPSEHTLSTTVGWMTQWSAAGQVCGPPLVAWVASRVGDWSWSWVVTGTCCVIGWGLTLALARHVRALEKV